MSPTQRQPRQPHLTVQQRSVLQRLITHRTLTNREAMLELGVGRLASRINELRHWVDIVSERPIKGQRFVRYRLVDPEAAEALLRDGEGKA